MNAIHSRADDTILIWEPDAASPNLKLCPHQIDVLRRSSEECDQRMLFDMLVCGLHQANHIIQLIFASSSSMSLIRGLHSLALLVATGNYFMRLVFVIVVVVRKCLVVSREPPAPHIAAQRKILLDMFFPAPLSRGGRSNAKQRQLALSMLLFDHSCEGFVYWCEGIVNVIVRSFASGTSSVNFGHATTCIGMLIHGMGRFGITATKAVAASARTSRAPCRTCRKYYCKRSFYVARKNRR